MTTCELIHEQLWDFLYGLLDAAEADTLRRHIDACPHCQEDLRVAQLHQRIVARAAQPIGSVPLFMAPGEDQAPNVAAAPAVADAAPPVVLPLPSAPVIRRSALRRSWPVWAAAAALLLALGLGNHFYQQGWQARQSAFGAARKNVENLNLQFALLQQELERDLARVADSAKKQALHLSVEGPAQYHPDLSNSYRIRTHDAEGRPSSADITCRLVDSASQKTIVEHRRASLGECAWNLTPAAKEWSSSCKIIVQAKAQETEAQIEANLARAPVQYVSHLALNKYAYQVGEVAFFRAVALDRYSLKPPAEPLPIRFALINEQGKAVKELRGQTGPGGIAGGDFALTDDLAGGAYTLQVSSLDPTKGAFDPQTRRLDIIRETGPIVEIYRDQLGALRSGQTANVPIRVLRQDGVPAANEAVIANIQTGAPVEVEKAKAPGAGKNQARAKTDYLQTRLDEDGKATLQFQMPANLPASNALLEVELFEGKGSRRAQQPLPVVPSELGIDFFPEGGDLIAGVTNHVYYRVRTAQGEPVNPEGRVMVLSDDDVILDGEPGQGVGSFSFIPDPRQNYAVRITSPEGVTELGNPFHHLGIKEQGVALHVPQPITRDDEPSRLVLRNAGPAQTLAILAVARGQLVAHQTVTVRKDPVEVTLTPPANAHGLVRLTVYEAAQGTLTPVAERLVFRQPTMRLDVAVAQPNGKQPYLPGQNVRLDVKTADERGQAEGAWTLAAVVDDRFQPERGPRSLTSHFHLAAELKMPEDLDQASLAMVDTPENRRALDRFLGTQGWRRFTSRTEGQAARGNGREAKANVAAPPLFFHRENNSLENIRGNVESRFALAVGAARDQADRRRRELQEEKTEALASVGRALEILRGYEQGPRDWLRLGLGVFAVALLTAGVLLLLWGLVRVIRKTGLATPALGGAFACLAIFLILHLAGRQFNQVESDVPGPRIVTDRPWAELPPQSQIAWAAPDRYAPAGAFPAASRTQIAAEDDLAPSPASASGGTPPHKDQTQTVRVADISYQFQRYLTVQNALPDSLHKKEADKQLNQELQGRFNLAKKAQDNWTRGDAKGKGGAGGLPKALPPIDPTAGDKKTWMFIDRARAYAHTCQTPGPDLQDTVLWHPALFTTNGQAQVAFDLSHNRTTYRVLIHAHSPEGRLGFYEGRLEVREAVKK